jgi:predicted AlkP superfamily phosphohydrolase/phosphomutase
MTRCLFIGLDAMDPAIMQAWAAQGRLPNIAGLLARARVVETETDPGTYVGSLWASIHTGVDPSVHGLYSWSRMTPGRYDFEHADERDLPVQSFWSLLSRNAIRCAVVDVPHCRLATDIDGIHVINWYTHFKTPEGFVTHPPSIAAELASRFGTDPVPRCDAVDHSEQGLDRLVDDLVGRAERRTTYVSELIASGRYDFVATTFGESHCGGHQCFAEGVALEGQQRLLAIYRAIDEGVGRLLDACPQGCSVLMLASHGMGPHHDGTHLAERLLLRIDPWIRAAPARSLADRALDRLEANKLRRWLGPLQRLLPPALPRRAYHRAFVLENNHADLGIRVNLAGREPRGIVPRAAYEAYLDEMEAMLARARRPGDDRPAFRKIVRPTWLYGLDPSTNPLPDMMLNWDRSAQFFGLEVPGIARVEGPPPGPRTGDHDEGGLAAFVGPFGHNRAEEGPIASHLLCRAILDLFGVEPTSQEIERRKASSSPSSIATVSTAAG